jgi:hypothetical protein
MMVSALSISMFSRLSRKSIVTAVPGRMIRVSVPKRMVCSTAAG